ncbi:MAG: trehalose hydrolase, partial [Bacteroidia bacterium]|nr:trehalose hydrolase [Bacteroidia bacterium]
MGIVFGGTPDNQTIYISKDDFWKAKTGYPEGGLCLPGGLNITVPELKGATFYADQVIANGNIHGVFTKDGLIFNLKTFVPAGNNSIIIELLATGKSCKVNLNLWAKSGFESKTESGEKDGIHWAMRHFETPDLDWPSHAAMAMKTIGASGNSFELRPGSSVTIIVGICTNHDNQDYFQSVFNRVKNTTAQTVKKLDAANDLWWKNFWSESFVETGDSILQKYYYGSQYLLACCSGNRNFPPGLCGNSITDDAINAWQGDYHTNYNFQAPWWACFSSNHIGLTEPYDAPVLDYMEKAKKHAREILNVRGVYYPVGIGPKGFSSSMYPLTEEKMMKTYGIRDLNLEGGHMFCGQRSDALFLTVNMFQRFYHTYDVVYARKVYPFIREVADFWEDYLKYENGQYNNYNDNFWEVGPWTSNWREDMVSGDYNNTNTLGLLRMFSKGFIEISSFLGEDQVRRERWTHIRQHLYPIPMVYTDGMIRIKAAEGGTSSGSEARTKPGFGRVSAYVFGFPGGVSGVKTDPVLADILCKEIGRWGTNPGGDADWNNLGNGIETYFTTAVRVGYDPKTIIARLKERIDKTALPNLWIPQSGGLTETLSAVPSCINEMLLQGFEGMIRIFPAWPAGRDARFENLRTWGAFLVSSEQKNGIVQFIKITSEKGRDCAVENPWPGRQVKIISGGKEAGNMQGG